MSKTSSITWNFSLRRKEGGILDEGGDQERGGQSVLELLLGRPPVQVVLQLVDSGVRVRGGGGVGPRSDRAADAEQLLPARHQQGPHREVADAHAVQEVQLAALVLVVAVPGLVPTLAAANTNNSILIFLQ